VESSSTNAYWHTNSEGVYFFNIHIHSKIHSSTGSTTSDTWIFGPLSGLIVHLMLLEDNSRVDSTSNATGCLNMLNSTRPVGGLHGIAYYPTNISPSTNTNGIAYVVLNFGYSSSVKLCINSHQWSRIWYCCPSYIYSSLGS